MGTAMGTALHIKTEVNFARADDCFVGTLDVCELQDREYASHLSADERAKYLSLPNERRQQEWLAGRLVAKYLFLNRIEMSQAKRCDVWRPSLSKLSAAALGDYSPWMYRKVEVLAFEGMPRLVWCGQERAEKVSLSHTPGLACACLATGAPAAIDIETAAPRNEAFYRKTFSEVERHGATLFADGEPDSANWYFTLLWTLKESALKLGWLREASLWNLPRIEIEGLPGLKAIEPFWCRSKLGVAFVLFTARVKEDRRAMRVRVAVTGTRNLVLTVLNPLIGAVN